MNTNVVVITGNVTRDLELKFGASTGLAILKGTVAVNGIKKEDVSFIDFTLFGKTAEAIASYANKGSKICITGYLQQQRWEKDGQNHSKISIVANRVELLDSKEKQSSTDDIFEPFIDDDLPF